MVPSLCSEPYAWRVAPLLVDHGFLKLPAITGPFVAMEYIEDDTQLFSASSRSTDILDSHKAMLMHIALIKLEALHNVGVIHGDLKRRNIILNWARTNIPIVVFIDFGFSRYPRSKHAVLTNPDRKSKPSATKLSTESNLKHKDVTDLCKVFGSPPPPEGEYTIEVSG